MKERHSDTLFHFLPALKHFIAVIIHLIPPCCKHYRQTEACPLLCGVRPDFMVVRLCELNLTTLHWALTKCLDKRKVCLSQTEVLLWTNQDDESLPLWICYSAPPVPHFYTYVKLKTGGYGLTKQNNIQFIQSVPTWAPGLQLLSPTMHMDNI